MGVSRKQCVAKLWRASGGLRENLGACLRAVRFLRPESSARGAGSSRQPSAGAQRLCWSLGRARIPGLLPRAPEATKSQEPSCCFSKT